MPLGRSTVRAARGGTARDAMANGYAKLVAAMPSGVASPRVFNLGRPGELIRARTVGSAGRLATKEAQDP